MERTKGTQKELAQRMQYYTALSTRVALAAKLGLQFDGDRNLYESLGYPTQLTYSDFVIQFVRQDIAQAIIMRPVRTTWRGPLQLVETNDAEETTFEKVWKQLSTSLQLKSKFQLADKLTGLGHYGVILLGFSDVQNKEGFASPVKKGNGLKLAYVKVLDEQGAQISTYDENTTSPRYGLPLTYDVTLSSPNGTSTYTLKVHYTRVIHIVDDPMTNESIGTPRLEVVFNRLMDLEKIVGGSGEMYWRGARPGFQGKIDKDYKMSAASEDALKDQITEYEHNLRRIFMSEGVSLDPLATQVEDPSKHVDVQIQMISAVTGIPKRILTGSERGELSSGQDSEEWAALIQTRREEFAEISIVRPFVDRLIEYGVLPQPVEEYVVMWFDLFAKSEKDRVDIGKVRSEALRNYLADPLIQSIVPPTAFFELFLGLTQDQIDLVNQMVEEGMDEEAALREVTQETEEEEQTEEERAIEEGKKVVV